MPVFTFKLQAVLQHRKMQEQQAQRAFAVVAAKQAALQARVNAMDDNLRDVLADLRANHLTGTLDLAFLAGHRRFMMAMQRQGIDLVQELSAIKPEVDAAHTALAEAAKQRKILEKLREKQLARWNESLAAKELAAADEVAMQMSFAAQRGES